MKYRNLILLVIGIIIANLFACNPYEDYTNDYDYSAVYFATQSPLRTIVAYDEMEFKVGVTLGGKRENNTDELVEFEIDPSILEDENLNFGSNFTLLPDEYYSLSDENRMIIPKGEFIGDVTVTLDRDSFTSDSLATSNTYALPLRITSATTDSVLSGSFDSQGRMINTPQDYTILVVKYISPLHGVYYHKGVERVLDENGEVVDETEYNNPDLSKNATWNLTTLSLDQVKTLGIGTNNNHSIILTRESDNNVSISTNSDEILNLEGNGTYQREERSFYLDYRFTRNNQDFEVLDTLILRQPPEEDLRFEEW